MKERRKQYIVSDKKTIRWWINIFVTYDILPPCKGNINAFAQFLSFPFLFERITFFLCVKIFIKISALKEKYKIYVSIH